MTELKPLGSQAWLSDSRLARLFAVIKKAGGEIRIAGGAVRNGLWGIAISDIDAATTLLPEHTMAVAKKAGFAVYPTGIEHGTISVVVEGLTVEVTTLRIDRQTDGRHAKVAFTTDWAGDAGRRDFTFNGLYCELSGEVFDETGLGLNDAKNRYVRFVGDAEQRIKEDYLRILRFFRFAAQYGRGNVDKDGLASCAKLATGLKKVSAERKRDELLKLLSGARAVAVIEIMLQHGVLGQLIEVDGEITGLSQLVAIENELKITPDGLRRLVMITSDVSHLRLSKGEHSRFKNMKRDCKITAYSTQDDQKIFLYRLGIQTYQDVVLRNWAIENDQTNSKAWQQIYHFAEQWEIPVFPVSGKDLVDLGYAPGKKIGSILSTLEKIWISGRFVAQKDALIDLIKTIK